MNTIIEAKNIIKVYGNHPQEAIELLNAGASREEILKRTGQTIGVNNASFSINKGEIFVLIGLSGSGKSTLLRCVNGLLKLDSGSLTVDGVSLHNLDEKKLRAIRSQKMSMVFQHFAVLPNRTILENVAFGLELKGVKKEVRRAKALKALQTVGLEAWSESLPDALSGGMKQRVGLARALVMESDILLMDEPFSALDALIRSDMQEELINLQRDIKKTILFVTHDLDEALRLGDKIAIMRDGLIEQIGTSEEILAHPANEYISRFLQNVDVTKILMAKNIARKPRMIIHENEGTLAVLRKFNQIERDYLFVISNSGQVLGLVHLEDLVNLREQDEHSISKAVRAVTVINETTPMQDVYLELRNAERAIAVVDENHRFIGEITPRSILTNLIERKGTA